MGSVVVRARSIPMHAGCPKCVPRLTICRSAYMPSLKLDTFKVGGWKEEDATKRKLETGPVSQSKSSLQGDYHLADVGCVSTNSPLLISPFCHLPKRNVK